MCIRVWMCMCDVGEYFLQCFVSFTIAQLKYNNNFSEKGSCLLEVVVVVKDEANVKLICIVFGFV